MTTRGELLRDAMTRTGTSQTELARLSGVRQPSISQALSGTIAISDDHLERMLSCMGLRLEVVRRTSEPDLTRAERRSWQLHRAVARRLDREQWDAWRPTVAANLRRLGTTVRGEPHERNLERWNSLFHADDLAAVRRVLTGLDRDSIEMREVSPMSGVLSEPDRLAALQSAH